MLNNFFSNFRMSSIHRNNSTVSSILSISKYARITYFIVQCPNVEKTRKIVSMDKILNPSNRRLRAGDDCTLKGEGRNHSRVKILFCSKLIHQIFLLIYNNTFLELQR